MGHPNIQLSLCLTYVIEKIFTIGIEDEFGADEAESYSKGDAILSEDR